MSGTSMATPHTAGAAAILAQEHPDWTGERIKAALTASAKPLTAATAYEAGAGRVDLTRATGADSHHRAVLRRLRHRELAARGRPAVDPDAHLPQLGHRSPSPWT